MLNCCFVYEAGYKITIVLWLRRTLVRFYHISAMNDCCKYFIQATETTIKKITQAIE